MIQAMTAAPPNVLLAGIVGSTAYGLAGPNSDVDRLGIYATPTETLHGLHTPRDSHVTTNPDISYHEAAKACRLILGGNPTASEILWLSDDLYETRTPLGDELIAIRTAFLSAKRTRDAYLGYATQQFRKLEARGDGSFSADTRKRTAKHARHLYRLCAQGYELYATGNLRIRLDDPQQFLNFGEQVAGGNIDVARDLMREYETAFDAATTVLPDQPDERTVQAWLLQVREHYLPVNVVRRQRGWPVAR
jgi:uncharacterized protein